MKRKFNCSKCDKEFELEADYFEPGISGTIVTSDGVVNTFIDPTEDHLCPICKYIIMRELLEKLLSCENKRRNLNE